MKKVLMTVLMIIGLFATVNAGTLSGTTPFGSFNIETDFNGEPPKYVVLPGATTMSGSFPVTFDDGRTHITFPVYFDDSTTLEDIINALWSIFN